MGSLKGKNGVALCFVSVLICVLTTAPLSAQSRIYTFDADFDEGILVNVNHDPPNNDQLQLNFITEPFPFINVAASARGTVVRINTETGEIIGEYSTAPEGRGLNPSRTTVDLDGNVWTSNRNEVGDDQGSVVKIGLVVGGTRVDADGTPNPAGQYLAPPFDYNTCVDRDSDGLIKTSLGLGNILPWPDITDGTGGVDGVVEDAEDECILCYQRLPDAIQARHVSVDANNDVWVGGYPGAQRMFYKLDGDTAAILDSFDARDFGCGGYGGLIDGSGVLWSASISQNKLLRYDLSINEGSCIDVSQSYGLGIDTNGFIWNSMWTNNSIVKISPAGVIEAGFPKPTSGASGDRGVAVTPVDDNVWVANSGGSDVSRLDNDGNLVKVIPLGADGQIPTGVAVDANGKVWVTCLGSNTAKRIDPNGGADGYGAVDLTVDLGAGAGPYNYSDMTGTVLLSAVQQGTWNVVYDTGVGGTTGCVISWNDEPEGAEPAGTSITVEARAADTEAGLTSEIFTVVTNGIDPGVTGRFVEIRATLARDPGLFDTPVLSDLSIECNEPPDCSQAYADLDCLWPPNHKWVPVQIAGVTDPDGDVVTITVTGITSDEPTATDKGSGGAKHSPDAEVINTDTAVLRAERSGKGDGRVYVIDFTATDGMGGVCVGSVEVKVPHDQSSPDCPAIDSGQNYDATQIN